MDVDKLEKVLQDLAYVYDRTSVNDTLGDDIIQQLITSISDAAYDITLQIKLSGNTDGYIPKLQSSNPLMRLWAAQELVATHKELARQTFVELANIGRRDFGYDKYGEPRIDFLYFSVALDAERGLWFMIKGTDDGFEDAPERFWEQQ